MTADDLAVDVDRITRYPRDEWLHDIEFPDGLDDDEKSPPIHMVTMGMRVNGRPVLPPHGGRLIDMNGIPGYGHLFDAIVVEATPMEDGTKVSFAVYADDVEWGDHPVVVGHDEGDPIMGTIRGPWRLFGLRVLAPAGIIWPVSDQRYHAHVAEHGKDEDGPTMIDGAAVTCRVVLFARTVSFTQRPDLRA